jgi:predicted RNA-binding protein with PUA-like domain
MDLHASVCGAILGRDTTVRTRTPRCWQFGRAGLALQWIFQCNPERYRLRDALRDGFDVRPWTVRRYLREIRPGDMAAMWISSPSAGVYAPAEIISGAEQSGDDPDPYWVDPADADEVSWRVGCASVRPFPSHTEVGARSRPRLRRRGNHQDARRRQPFPVSDRTWQAIVARTPQQARRRTRSLNPAWATDELILALDLNLRDRGHIPSPRDPDIVALKRQDGA